MIFLAFQIFLSERKFTYLLTYLFVYINNFNPLQSGAAFLYPLKTLGDVNGMFSGGTEKLHRAVMG